MARARYEIRRDGALVGEKRAWNTARRHVIELTRRWLEETGAKQARLQMEELVTDDSKRHTHGTWRYLAESKDVTFTVCRVEAG